MSTARPVPPFFIIGSDRSGSTMLRLMVNEHSLLHVPRESWFLIDLLDHLPLDAALTPAQVDEAKRLITAHPRWPDWEMDAETLAGILAPCPGKTLAELIEAVFRASAAASGKPHWGDKTPEYVSYVERLHRVFPEARFVHIIRDARDVSVSLMRVQFRGTGIIAAARHWLDTVTAGVAAGRRLPETQYLEIDYDRLVLDTEGTLRQICTFLGVDFEKPMLRFYERAGDKIPERERPYHKKTQRPPSPADTQRWRRELGYADIALCEAICGPTMDLVGQPRKFRDGLAAWGYVVAMSRRFVLLAEAIGRRLLRPLKPVIQPILKR